LSSSERLSSGIDILANDPVSSLRFPMSNPLSEGLPTPFVEDPWRGAQKEAARALWDWRRALFRPHAGAAFESAGATFEAEARKAEAGRMLALVPADVARAAYRACEAEGLPRERLADQVRAARRFGTKVRFADAAELRAFSDLWAGSHALLLAAMAGAKGGWQRPWIKEMAFGFFLTGRLAALHRDLARDWFFFPLADLERAGIAVEDFREGRTDEKTKRVLWKQVVGARDAFAQGRPLIEELEPRYARSLKRWWHGALEVLREIERRDYDLSRPLGLSRRHRLQAYLQAMVGRSIFKRG